MQKPTTTSSSLNSSSMVDLKAELFRKQEQFKQEKLQSQNASYVKARTQATSKKPNLFSKKNAGVESRASRDFEEKVEEDNILERSKKTLERKAKLYEQMTSGKELPEEDGSGLYLVDFQKKVIDDVMERRDQERKDIEDKERKEKEDREKQEAEEDKRILQEPVPEAENEEDKWVDYVDSFGRSRRCLKKDIPRHQITSGEVVDRPTLLSADMQRELERQRWEKEAEEMQQKDAIHYADVQHNEIRSHGVGYYKFSREEEQREEQMDTLLNLRSETKDAQSKREKIKAKRKAALTARLAKVKQRRREKAGLPAEDDEQEGERQDGAGSDDNEIGPSIGQMIKAEPEPLTRDDSLRERLPNNREWDRGKQVLPEKTEKDWIETQRNEREEEFAPPSFYYDSKISSGKQLSAKTKHLPGRLQNQSRVPPPADQSHPSIGNNTDGISSSHMPSGDGSGTIITDAAAGGYVSDFVKQQLRKLRQEVDTSIQDSCITDSVVNAYNASSGQQLDSGASVIVSNFDNNAQRMYPSGYSQAFNMNMAAAYTTVPAPYCSAPALNMSYVNVAPPNWNIPPPSAHVPPPNFINNANNTNLNSNTNVSTSNLYPNLHLPPPPPPPPPAFSETNHSDTPVSCFHQPCQSPSPMDVPPISAPPTSLQTPHPPTTNSTHQVTPSMGLYQTYAPPSYQVTPHPPSVDPAYPVTPSTYSGYSQNYQAPVSAPGVHNQSASSQQPYPSTTTIQGSEVTKNNIQGIDSRAQASLSVSDGTTAPPKIKYVDKTSIIDTRLIANEGD